MAILIDPNNGVEIDANDEHAKILKEAGYTVKGVKAEKPEKPKK